MIASRTLTRYFLRFFGVRIAAVLLAMSALVELVEMLDATRRLLGADAHLGNILTFSILRLPLAIEQLFPLAVLVGSALAFRSLSASGEISVLRAAGLSPYRLVLALMPLAVILATINIAVVDRIAPGAERAFVRWWDRIASDDDAPRDRLWLRVGDDIVAIDDLGPDGRQAWGVTLYQRNAEGLIRRRIVAGQAVYTDRAWRLADVSILDIGVDGEPVMRQETMDWPGGPKPGWLLDIAHPIERLSVAESGAVLAGKRPGSGSIFHYSVLIHKSFRSPLLPALMLLLSMPAATGAGRVGSRRGIAVSLLSGFGFLIFDGFMLAIAEAGGMPTGLSAWAAPALFLLIGMTFVLYAEETRSAAFGIRGPCCHLVQK